MIPGPSSTADAARGTTASHPADAPKVWCQICAVTLPDEFAEDAFPMCGECIETLLNKPEPQP